MNRYKEFWIILNSCQKTLFLKKEKNQNIFVKSLTRMGTAMNVIIIKEEMIKRYVLEDALNMEKELILFIVKIKNAQNAWLLKTKKEKRFGIRMFLKFKRNVKLKFKTRKI